MDLPIKELNKILDKAGNILITGPANPNLDVLGSAMAWQIFLLKKQKKVSLCFDGRINRYNFLPKDIDILDSLGDLNKFKIVLDVSETKVKQLSYDMKDDKLEISIVPEDGMFNSQDVKTSRGEYRYDLIIILGADSLGSLGKIFSENRAFFHSRPILNIDASVLNENYGELNVVEASATSVAEMSYHIFENKIDKDMSTCLLGAMISATNSFQSPKVTPGSLDLASELIIKGAEREKIIEGLYRTKDIYTLKSWGKILSRLKKHKKIISSYLNHGEIDGLSDDFSDMVKDLIVTTPDTQVAVIFYQQEIHSTEVWVYTRVNINALDLVKDLEASGTRNFAEFSIEQDLQATQEKVLSMISKKLDIINEA